MSLGTSVVAALFTITSKVLSWDLGGYEYYGHDFAYSGSFYLPFAIAVIPSLISRRYVLAIVLATITALVFAPAGALMCGVIVLVLVVKRADGEWRRVAPWFGLPLLIFAWSAWIQMAIGARITERFTRAEDVAVVMVNGHLVPLWLSGQIFASTYLGFFLWCAMSALAWGKWRALDANQRLPVADPRGVHCRRRDCRFYRRADGLAIPAPAGTVSLLPAARHHRHAARSSPSWWSG